KKAMLGKVEEPEPKKKLTTNDFVSTGSTMLNLACTGHYKCGFPLGRMVLTVGDSDAGKTLITLTCLAEAANNPRFKNHLLIHDDIEGGAMMDMVKFFGEKAAERISAPSHDKEGNPVYSEFLEEMYDWVETLLDAGKPFIAVIDSTDGLD